MLPITLNHNVLNNWWLMSWKGFGRNWPWPKWGIVPVFVWRDSGKQCKTSFSAANDLTETQHCMEVRVKVLNKNTHAYYQSMPELQSWFHYCKSLPCFSAPFTITTFPHQHHRLSCRKIMRYWSDWLTDWLTHTLTHSLTYSLTHSHARSFTLSWTRWTLPHYLFIPLTSDLNVTPKPNLNTCHKEHNGSTTSVSHIRTLEAGRFGKSVLPFLLFKSA